MIRPAILFVACVLAPLPAMAQQTPPPAAATPSDATPDAAHIAAATRLLDAIHIERQYDVVLGNMMQIITPQLFERLLDSESVPDRLKSFLSDPEELKSAKAIFNEEVTKEFKKGYPQLRAATAREYASVFTVAELDAIAKFYGSPVGQKALIMLPQLQRKLMPVGAELGAQAGKAAMKATLERLGFGDAVPAT